MNWISKLFHRHNFTKWIKETPTQGEKFYSSYRLKRKCKKCGKIEKYNGLIEMDFEGNVYPYTFKH